MEKLSFDGHILIHLRARVKGVCEASVRLSSAAPHIAVCTLPDPASLSSFFLTDGPVQKAMEATSEKTPNGKLGESQAPCTRVELFTVAFISLSLMRNASSMPASSPLYSHSPFQKSCRARKLTLADKVWSKKGLDPCQKTVIISQSGLCLV